MPEAQKSSWMSFVKQLASVSGDLSSVSAPSFILSPTSLVEFSAYWSEPHGLLAQISEANNPEERMLAVLKWFIVTLSGQYLRREKATGSEKKPLNPILGELFYGSWEGAKGKTTLISEQVSHHPPITAYYIENKTAKVSLQGHNAQKTSFSGKNINVKQVGYALLKVELPQGQQESYLITLPKLRIEGLFFGSPYVELAETTLIQASTGYHASISYAGKGYFSGKAHTFTAKIGPSVSAASSSPTYVIEGQWNGKSTFTSASKKRSGQPFVDAAPDSLRDEITVAPVDQQGEWESRKVWFDVAEGIKKQQFEASTASKVKLENLQRQRRKDEAAEGRTWQIKHFDLVSSDSEYTKLAGLAQLQPATQEAYVYKRT